MKNLISSFLILLIFCSACNNTGNTEGNDGDTSVITEKVTPEDIPVTTSIEILAAKANQLIDSTAVVEELAKGFSWAEGPVWVSEINALLFSDVPENKIYKWSEKDGLSVFITPSGFTDSSKVQKGDGSNGLMLDAEGDLVLCQHGDRRIAALISGFQNPAGEYITLADKFNGKKFNSPNDLAIKKNGDIYFTDPPYGLKDDKDKELNFNGVFKASQIGEVTMLVDSLTRPNGIAFSPDEKTLYVGNSDPDKVFVYAFQVDAKGSLSKPRIFFDASGYKNTGPGLPDGLKVHKNGIVFASGPGGVFLISPKGKLLAIVHTSKSTANLAFDSELKYLYLTTTDRLLRVKLK